MRPLPTMTDEQLLAECSRGRAGEAFGVFYARHEARILAYFARRVASAELAADLAAETFAQALTARERFRPRRAPAVAWLYGIGHHVLVRSLRRGRVEDRARRRLNLPALVLHEHELAAIEAFGASDALLQQLPPDQRAAVAARIVDERGYPEIAAELRCSEAVVRQRVSRGLATLRRHLQAPKERSA